MDLPLIFSKAEKKGKSYADYLSALEEERKKILVFQRELPFSLHLVTYAIESCRRQIAAELFPPSSCVRSEITEDEEEPISHGNPAFEEFIPIKQNFISIDKVDDEFGDTAGKKQNWLKSAQLWTPHPEKNDNNRDSWLAVAGKEKKSTSTFLSFLPQKGAELEMAAAASEEAITTVAATTSSTSETRGVMGSCSSGSDERRTIGHRKARRCWSQDLHRRFLDALSQLGGTEVATPKRIREIMKEDGLTNDEVKSHLQKYRLHSRRPCQTSHGKASSAQPLIFAGGLWLPSSTVSADATIQRSRELSASIM